jgi:hypothetical protein
MSRAIGFPIQRRERSRGLPLAFALCADLAIQPSPIGTTVTLAATLDTAALKPAGKRRGPA